jgi:hypothetical protein
MALAEFWENVWARNPLFCDGVSPPDVQPVTAEALDAELAKRQEWRRLGPLKGYDPNDFDFLAPAVRDRLTELVTAFNAIAPELRSLVFPDPPQEVRLAETTGKAQPSLRDIILLLKQDRYRDPDALRFGKLVELELGDTLPEGVVDLRFQVGNDWSGDPGFSAWAFVAKEATATEELLFAFSDRVRPRLTDAMYRVAPGHLCYLSFRFLGDEIAVDDDAEAAA